MFPFEDYWVIIIQWNESFFNKSFKSLITFSIQLLKDECKIRSFVSFYSQYWNVQIPLLHVIELFTYSNETFWFNEKKSCVDIKNYFIIKSNYSNLCQLKKSIMQSNNENALSAPNSATKKGFNQGCSLLAKERILNW